jgi:hypothetical protein
MRRPGRPAVAVPPEYLLKLEPRGVEDRDAWPAEEAEAWNELVTRTSQSLGVTYYLAERVEHVLRVVPPVVRELFLALPRPFRLEVAYQMERRIVHQLALKRSWELLSLMARLLADWSKLLSPDATIVWGLLWDRLGSLGPRSGCSELARLDWFSAEPSEAARLRRLEALPRCAELSSVCLQIMLTEGDIELMSTM